MSDGRKSLLDDLGDLDWDRALDEWEQVSFSPEVARDADTDRAAGPLGGSEGTVVAPVPRELRGDAHPPPTPELRPSAAPAARPSSPPLRSSLPPSIRGGLDQLFSRRSTPARPTGTISHAPSEGDTAVARRESLAPDSERPMSHERVAPRLLDLSYDDSEESATVVARSPLEDGDTATSLPSEPEVLPADDEMPTIGRPSARPDALGAPPSSERPRAAEAPSSFERERPGPRWLDGDAARAFASRIEWLEEEARALDDPTARGRALLAVSELSALAGDSARANAFAIEARDAAPELPLASIQARQLMPHDPDLLAEALDAEAARSPTPSARAHAVLLAADLLRTSGRGDAAVERWESACKLDPADARAPIARAALALAQSDYTNGALRLSDNSELVSLDRAVATALRLRGVERPGVEIDDLPVNDGLRRARAALASGDVVGAAQAIGEMTAAPEVKRGALWLSAALGAVHIGARRAAARALKALANEGEDLARRQLAARGLELADPELVAAALDDAGSFDPAERVALRILGSSGDESIPSGAEIDALADEPALAPLSDALTALAGDDAAVSTAAGGRLAGDEEARALTALGRLLASNAGGEAVDDALAKVRAPTPPSALGVALETAVRAKRWGELGEALAELPASDDDESVRSRHIAAALIAERAGNRDDAKRAWGEAARRGAVEDGLLRIRGELDDDLDLGAELLRAADEMPDGLASAALRLEALARAPLPDEEQALVLEHVHRSAPALGVGAFLAERIALRRGDLEEVLRWIHERRGNVADPLETALDAIREALLVADRDPELASTLLEEAHRARPDDVALRELYERLATERLPDRGAWREERAVSAGSGAAAAPLWLDAALEHERAGDAAAALRAAQKARGAGDRGLSTPIIERAEIAAGETAGRIERLVAIAKEAEDPVDRREALERLAALEAVNGAEEALARHRAILEVTPDHEPSLRRLEHELIGLGAGDDLLPVFEQIAVALDGVAGECAAHAQHAARLRVRQAPEGAEGSGAWERTHGMARLAATQPEPSLWSLRALNAHARAQKDERAILDTTLALLERTQRPAERAALLVRASESAARLAPESPRAPGSGLASAAEAGASEGDDHAAEARAFLEQAATEDPGDVVTWGFLAEVRGHAGDAREAAEACESLARTSAVPSHQLLAWNDAAKIWLDEVDDPERGMTALEAAAEIDPSYADAFTRLSALYAERRLDAELARLLERRLETIEDEDERIGLTVELARALSEMGEIAKAKGALEGALETRPSHTTALAAMAELCVKEGDWTGAEGSYVRLARLLTDPDEQRAIYERLGEIYAVHAPNLSRAEMALKEVLKRAPSDPSTLAKLVSVYKRQGDVQRAVETQQEIISAATDPDARLASLVELASIHETVGRDPRKSEQVLDSARKEFPTSVVALRAMAEFYARQRQMPAMQILLDRSAADARRAFAQGRFVPSLFEVLHAAFELRGKLDAARVVAATLAAVEGQPSALAGAEALALDPRLDDLLAPDMMSPPLRALLLRAGDALDAVAPLDLRVLGAAPLPPGTPVGASIGSIATVTGLGALQVFVSPHLGRVALPISTSPPMLLVGKALVHAGHERASMFVIVRALKMIVAHASAMLRGTPREVQDLVAGLFTALNPTYAPQGVDPRSTAELARRIGAALPRNLDPTVGVIALEAAGMVGARWTAVPPAASAWANRVALLAVGDPSAALDALAWGLDQEGAPTASEERAAWIARHPEARDLMTFSVTDVYAEARTRLGVQT